jgi:hypothetical protein
MEVLRNTLDATPHHPGDLVLHIRGEAVELELRYVQPRYRIYIYRLDLGRTDWKPRTIEVADMPVLAGAAAWKVWAEVAGD